MRVCALLCTLRIVVLDGVFEWNVTDKWRLREISRCLLVTELSAAAGRYVEIGTTGMVVGIYN